MRLVVLFALVGLVTASAQAPQVAVHASAYGRIVFDGRGFVLYAFSHDPRARSTCYGACAVRWPPYVVKSAPPRGGLVGTTKRRDGSLQLTYAGRPLYYYIDDRKARQILCQGVSEFGGYWRVLKPNGAPVR